MTPDDFQKLVTMTLPFGKHPSEIGRRLALMQEIDHNGLSELSTPRRSGGQGRRRGV